MAGKGEECTGGTGTAGLRPAEAHLLADCVAYAPGSVVSRTLVDRAEGTLTLFAFDEGQGLSEHTAPFDAYVIVLEGEAELRVGDRMLSAGPGEAVLMPANVPHAVRAPLRLKMLLVMIRA